MAFVLRPISEGSDAGNPRNEDRFGYTDRAAWLLDGATALGPSRFGTRTEAEWIVDEVTQRFVATFSSEPRRATLSILENIINEITLAYGPIDAQPAYALPSCGMALVRHLGERIEISNLADVKAYIVDPEGGVQTLGGGALEALDSQALSAFRAIQANQTLPDLLAARAEVAPSLKANRAKMNQKDGYFVLAPDLSCLTGLDSVSLEATKVRYIILASDGFYDLWETYHLWSMNDCLQRLIAGEGRTLLAALRTLEKNDPQAIRFPRFKVHDDATWLVLENAKA